MSSRRDDPSDLARLCSESLRQGGTTLLSAALTAKKALAVVVDTIRRSNIDRSLIVCASKSLCSDIELALESTEEGIRHGPGYVAIYPSRLPEDARADGNCRNFVEADGAMKRGLPPTESVCMICLEKDGCTYMRLMREANASRHAVMNAARAEIVDIVKAAEKRHAVFIVTNHASDVLVPRVKVRFDDRAEALEMLKQIRAAVQRAEANSADRMFYFMHLGRFVAFVIDAVEGGGNEIVKLPEAFSRPSGWAASLNEILKRRGWEPQKEIMRALVAAASGELRAFAVRGDPKGVTFFAVWKPRLFVQPVLVLDATLSAERLERALGRPAVEISGNPPPPSVVQVPERVTSKKRPSVISKLLRGYLAVHEGLVGVIYGKEHHAEIAKHLEPYELARVIMADWHADLSILTRCTASVVLGHPEVPPDEVIKRLIQSGQTEAATVDGDWGDSPWTATLPWGQKVAVARRTYRQSEWRLAYEEIVQGRLRAVLAALTGQVSVHTDVELGIAVDTGPPTLDQQDGRLLAALPKLSDKSAIGNSSEESALIANLSDNPKPLPIKDLEKITGIAEWTVRRKLARLKEAGLADRTSERGDWFATDPRPKGGR